MSSPPSSSTPFLSTQGYKGTRDFYPDEMRVRRWMFGRMHDTARKFGYEEYDGPVLESFELYAAKSGEELVNEQLYHFTDRGDRKVAIRPEMTPTMARLVAAKFHELQRPIRLYSIPNLWRYEKPQRGRLREHWQLNIDVLGGDPLLADAEVLQFAHELMRAYGGESYLSYRINNRHLMDQFFGTLGLDAVRALRVSKAIDAKAKIGEEKFTAWLAEVGLDAGERARVGEFFAEDLASLRKKYPGRGSDELAKLFDYLAESGLGGRAVFDPTIMRGLNYYTGTVFELYDVSPENRRALSGGGRYDNLLGLFGKNQLSGVGFGMGDVTLRDFLEVHGLLPTLEAPIDVYVGLPSADFRAPAEMALGSLRNAGFAAVTPLEFGGMGTQIKQALKRGARYAVLFGETEWAEKKVILKDLRKNEQRVVALTELVGHVSARP